MQIWPAIDLRGGKCVRLQQGDYHRETVFGEDPAAMAQHFESQGGEYLHLVDLDGARSGKVENWASIEAILAAVKMRCGLGGGVRDEATIARLLDAGLERVVIGTLALKQPDWFRQMCRKFPGRLARGGRRGAGMALMIRHWSQRCRGRRHRRQRLWRDRHQTMQVFRAVLAIQDNRPTDKIQESGKIPPAGSSRRRPRLPSRPTPHPRQPYPRRGQCRMPW